MVTVVGIEPPAIRQVRFLANLLDSAITIPIIRKRIGLDPLLGMIPGAGDVIGLLFSLYILYVAFDLGLPRGVLVRMLLNIVLDSTVGSIPVAGDVFDMFWKANKRNVQLLESAYYRTTQKTGLFQ